MKSLLFIGAGMKDQANIKSFLEKDFELDFNPSVHNAIDIITKKPYDVLAYDVDNVFPFRMFLKELEMIDNHSKVIAFSKKIHPEKIDELYKLGAECIIMKPLSRKKLLDGINGTFNEQSDILGTEKTKVKSNVRSNFRSNITEIETWMAMRKDAFISRLSTNGLELTLPLALEEGMNVLLKNAETCSVIDYQYDRLPSWDMTVRSCQPSDSNQYKSYLEFNNLTDPSLLKKLNKFLMRQLNSKAKSAPSKRVLIADSDRAARKFYQKELEEEGYFVESTVDGLKILEILNDKQIDLVIMDLQLHQVNGEEVIKEIKSSGINVPIIVVTSVSKSEAINKLSENVEGIFSKPLDSFDLAAIVAPFLWGDSDDHDEETQYELVNDGYDLSCKVHFITNVMVAFRDRLLLLNNHGKKVIFGRSQPIAPGTRFLVKNDTIFSNEIVKQNPTKFVELKTKKCKRDANGTTYLILAEFQKAS